MDSSEALASFLAALPEGDRARFSRYAALDLPKDPAALTAAQNLTASDLLATTGTRGQLTLATWISPALQALELAETYEERELALVCLAQAHFQNHRGDREEAAEVCRRAVEALEGAGDAGSAERFRRRLQRLF